MRTLLITTILILGASFVAKAEGLQKVELDVATIKIVDQKELGNRRYELTLSFDVATPDCIEEFVGFVENQENEYIAIAKISDFCEKPLFAETATAKVKVGIYTKSLPARGQLKIGKKLIHLEEDFGQVSLSR